MPLGATSPLQSGATHRTTPRHPQRHVMLKKAVQRRPDLEANLPRLEKQQNTHSPRFRRRGAAGRSRAGRSEVGCFFLLELVMRGGGGAGVVRGRSGRGRMEVLGVGSHGTPAGWLGFWVHLGHHT
ncbi:hypothetical protein E2C01_063026 [Portunus trituberculatus]|uniref:Uncharacterized protein n=1 Tax=Portunus trituberculatus TaxID=210409 RepID=A0A5B7HJP6_PORTR|nr:hypothetical protein [Portunus trituberculatus]